MEIEGRGVLVTGGASGLGEAAARLFAALGAKVAILDRDPAALEIAKAEIGCAGMVGDVTSAEGLARAISEIDAALGGIRVCVNCAGVGPAERIVSRDGPMRLENFARVVEINLVGTFNVLRLVGAAMGLLEPETDGERGVIVNVASIAAYDGQIGQAAYAASKGGVAALTLPAAREFARFGVRVVAIAPGLFATPMLRALPQEAQRSLAESMPFPRRLGDTREFADLVRHIVENRMLNGEVIRLDGALRLAPK